MLIKKNEATGLEKKIEKYEKWLGYKLPEQYCKFLLKYNGGKTIFTSIKDNYFENDIEYFYGFIKVDRDDSINNKYVKNTQSESLTEKNILGIAYLGGGDVLAIGIGEENNGQIFYCDYDNGYKENKLADTLKEFIDMVESEEPDKNSLEHPDDIIKRVTAAGNPPSEFSIQIFWKQYEELLNLEQEEVILEY